MSVQAIPAGTALDSVLDALRRQGSTVRTVTGGHQATCPVPEHNDTNPSLSVTHAEGRAGGPGHVLLHCHAGCEAGTVVAALGLTWPDLYDAPLPDRGRGVVRDFPYVSGGGQWIGSVQRLGNGDDKTFRPVTTAGGRLVRKSSDELKTTPYRLPEVIAAIDQGRRVYIAEGERDADTLAAQGYVATCNAGGAGKWTDQHAAWLRGADVVICRDNDPAGHAHAHKVAATLAGVAARVRMVEPAEGKDVTDHILAGHGIGDLRAVELPPAEDPHAGDAEDGELDPSHRPSWIPVDLRAIVEGTHELEQPSIGVDGAGPALFYGGRTHWLQGQSESGKSWVAQMACARALVEDDTHTVLFIDYESDAASVVARMLALGVPGDVLVQRFRYIAPERSWQNGLEREAFDTVLAETYTVAVVDGVTVAHGLDGVESNDTDGMARWCRTFPRAIADRTGAAVLCVDHVSKTEPGRFAIGSQAKLNSVTGAAYVVEPDRPLAPGKVGSIALRVAKDRIGAIRTASGAARADRTALTATITVDSRSPERIDIAAVGCDAQDTDPARPATEKSWRPTVLMERGSRWIETHPDKNQTDIVKGMGGKAEYARQAIGFLVEDGFVSRSAKSNGNATTYLHRSVTPYRQADADAAGTASPSIDGGTRGTRPGGDPTAASGTWQGRGGDAARPAETPGRGDPGLATSQDQGRGGTSGTRPSTPTGQQVLDDS